ncbi:RNA-binding family protein isoform 1 [Melia azedarach]|uniref:RNA-binding family protein isoform 1 n=1 Tax=Melia azedarach TaxID=155640 RepID=A0ACC1YI07_MELAZ|nr:RNA-binding family protein isoform 1 [Melia azedarach]
MESSTEAEYAAFLEKVRRTVYLDNLSPQVTESVLKTALSQFGTVKNVQFIPSYTESKNIQQFALVEMDNSNQAKAIISSMGEFPFMMSGMPRSVRARAAEVEMFDDRPIKPGRKIQCRWLDPDDPDFEVAQKLKHVVRKHTAEASFVLKQQLDQEEMLAKQQADSLKQNYKKYELLDSIMADGTANRLARHYDIRNLDD